MKKTAFLFLFFNILVYSQTYQIKYATSFEGKEEKNDDNPLLITNSEETFLLTTSILEGKKTLPYDLQKINRRNNNVIQYAFLKNEKIISNFNSSILSKYDFIETDETKKILGYTCKKATTTVSSNAIEVWYTNELNVKGAPNLLGQDLGLVLEYTRNGNNTIRAYEVKKTKPISANQLFGDTTITELDALSYKDEIWKDSFTTISVFKNDTIRFSSEAKSDEHIQRFAGGTVILKKVKFPVINTKENIFIELTEQSNGDAYDRTGSVFIIPENKKNSFLDALSKGIKNVPEYDNGNGKKYQGVVRTSDYEPAIELMRFFTPFGIQEYNDKIKLKGKTWQEKVSYRQDISEFQPLLNEKEFWIGVYIGNYDKGGHLINLDISIHKDFGLYNYGNNTVLSLFNSTNLMEMAEQNYGTMFSIDKGLEVNFTLEKDLNNAMLRYITTGHGGWENGDEFVPKENRISLDGKQIFSFIPWRTDCGSYRLYNPASGNFKNGLSSSDLSRSNWCPGTTTNPVYIPLGNLKAGKHQLQIQIPLGKEEGSSFSSWNVSGVLIGNK